MASQLSALGRRRKADLKQLKILSRRLDAAQEKLEREINRIQNRKKAIPELSDFQRLTTLTDSVDQAATAFANSLYSMGVSWTTI